MTAGAMRLLDSDRPPLMEDLEVQAQNLETCHVKDGLIR